MIKLLASALRWLFGGLGGVRKDDRFDMIALVDGWKEMSTTMEARMDKQQARIDLLESQVAVAKQEAAECTALRIADHRTIVRLTARVAELEHKV